MSSILKVRLPDGSVVDIPAIKGVKGDTPVKGIDYWTEEEIESIQQFIHDEAVRRTPYIGINGNWYIDDDNLGVKAEGQDGYTPIKGTDYWTEADKAEIKSYVDDAILGGEW